MQIASRISSWTSGGGPTPASDTTRFEVVTTEQYNTAGIFSATAIDSTVPTIVDWGDGSTDSVLGDISALTHSYSVAGTYEVEISDNINSVNLRSNEANNNRYILTRILNISSNVTTIPDYGFYYLGALYEVNAGSSGNLTLGSYAFTYGYESQWASKPSGTWDFSGRTILAIPTLCFEYAYGMRECLLPDGILSMGSGAFEECRHLESIIVPEGVTTLGAGVFYSCTALAHITLPSTLTTIGQFSESKGVFGHCTSLAEITLPAALTNIGSNCFKGCSSLGTITSMALSAPSLGNYVFGQSGSYTGANTAAAGTNRLYVPTGATGYTSRGWATTLCDSTKCGFTLVEA